MHSGGEIAFLDVRETGQFVDGHALFAVPLPYSRLECLAPKLVPRRHAPVLLLDGGDGIGQLAAQRLEELGYARISIIDGGMAAWAQAGFPVYQGVNVPSKVLGELAEAVWHPQMITADALAFALESDDAPHFFDCRPAGEYEKMRIPGARCMPNGELAHRLAMLDGRSERAIVLTCAGRTRGITGAIGLAISGHSGPIHALENGTQGWALSGRRLERDNAAAPLPQLDAAARRRSRQAADAIMRRFVIETVSLEKAAGMMRHADRSTFAFDLRTPEEAAARPLRGACVVAGVQLVQATDQFVGVRHARLILCCDTGLRSAIAAFWLRQLGFEPHVAILDDAATWPCLAAIETICDDWRASLVEASDLARANGTPLLLDVRDSKPYRDCHAKQALWTIRPRLAAALPAEKDMPIVFIDEGGDDQRAALCAKDAMRLGFADARMLAGGHPALETAGYPLVSTPDDPADKDRIDFAFFVHDRHDGNLDSSKRYLAWEIGLVEQLDETERGEFKLLSPQPSATG